MAYSGSTASSSAANPPRLQASGGLYGHSGGVNQSTGLSTSPLSPNNQGGQLWTYVSTNKTTDLNATGNTFFSDGDDLGMRPGDVVIAIQYTSAGSSVILSLHAVSGVSTSGAALSTGAFISSTYA